MGLGVQGGGVGVVKFFQQIGCSVTVTDLRSEIELKSSIDQLDAQNLQFTLGGHREADFQECDVVIQNPGVPHHNSYLEIARKFGKEIYMETALFAKYTTKPIIGITGTRGKTTTTILIHNLLKTLGHVQLGGNIPGSCTLSLLETENSETIATVLELSSWQLQGFNQLKLSPHSAVLTNIYPDHLNRYEGMAEYIADKAVITKYQTEKDFLFYNRDDETVVNIANTSQAQTIPYSSADLDASFEFNLPGQHNRSNAAAAVKVGQHFSVNPQIISEILSEQQSIPYRLETIRTIRDIQIINDTTSTTPVALITAIKAQIEPITLIMGGQSKNLPVDECLEFINANSLVKHIILIPGSGTDDIRSKLDSRKIIGDTGGLSEAVEIAIRHALPHEVILFSPGFTSFDQYKNEFERGDHFNQLVNKLA